MRNIRRLAAHDDLCRQLGQTAHPKTGTPLFRTFRELACFAAMLGFEQGRPKKLDGPTDLFVDARIFESSETAVDVVYLLGLAATKDPDVLLDTDAARDKLSALFEEYAAGGLEILAEWLAAEPSDPNGDLAVLTAIKRGGYLDDAKTVEDALGQIDF